MMTTPYAAFISDPSLFSFPSSRGSEQDVVARNRRFLYILTFWAGALCGGALLKWSSLWAMTAVVALCKVLVAGMIWASRGSVEDADEEDGDEEAGSQAPAGNTGTVRSRTATGRSDGPEAYRGEPGHQHLESSWLDHLSRYDRKRSSSVFERLQNQKPRDEQTVAM